MTSQQPYLPAIQNAIAKQRPTVKISSFQKNGFEQLKSVGIDVNQGIFRPIKEIKIIGLQPIVGWDFLKSA